MGDCGALVRRGTEAGEFARMWGMDCPFRTEHVRVFPFEPSSSMLNSSPYTGEWVTKRRGRGGRGHHAASPPSALDGAEEL
jgi:hypothetical protein